MKGAGNAETGAPVKTGWDRWPSLPVLWGTFGAKGGGDAIIDLGGVRSGGVPRWDIIFIVLFQLYRVSDLRIC